LAVLIFLGSGSQGSVGRLPWAAPLLWLIGALLTLPGPESGLLREAYSFLTGHSNVRRLTYFLLVCLRGHIRHTSLLCHDPFEFYGCFRCSCCTPWLWKPSAYLRIYLVFVASISASTVHCLGSLHSWYIVIVIVVARTTCGDLVFFFCLD